MALVSGGRKRQRVAAALLETLRTENRTTQEIHRLCQRLEVDYKTAERCIPELDIDRRREGGLGAHGYWVWALRPERRAALQALTAENGYKTARPECRCGSRAFTRDVEEGECLCVACGRPAPEGACP